ASPPADASSLAALQIKALSNRADLISGGDALVEIVVPAGSPSEGLHVVAGTRDVSAAFARRADGRTTGLVTGLGAGNTTITADFGGKQGAALTVTNHPIGGPVFSGPQIQPWVCATPVPTPGDASTPATAGSGL